MKITVPFVDVFVSGSGGSVNFFTSCIFNGELKHFKVLMAAQRLGSCFSHVYYGNSLGSIASLQAELLAPCCLLLAVVIFIAVFC